MATQTQKPNVYVFNEINIGKYKGVKHYELNEQTTSSEKLGRYLNISVNRKFALSNPDYWVKVKEGKKWKTHCLTGLFKTNFKEVYKGDADRKKHLLLFKFVDNQTKVIVYYFENYFTNDLSNVSQQINL